RPRDGSSAPAQGPRRWTSARTDPPIAAGPASAKPDDRVVPRVAEWEGLDDPPELVQPPAPAATGAEHGDRAAAGEVEQVADLRLGTLRPGQVGLMDDDHVGDLQEPGLLPLEFVS